MSPADFDLISPKLTPVTLPVRFSLEEPNTEIESVYFLTSGVCSMSAVGARRREIEIAILGHEGMSGIAAILGAGLTPNRTQIRIAGEGYRMSTSALAEAMERSATLTALLLRYAQSVAVQTAHTVLANGHDVLETRLSRWLVMCHDRADGDELKVTHESIAINLGVRRAGVTDALHLLEGEGLIQGSRSSIRIKDRLKLVERTNDSYGAPEREYTRLIGCNNNAIPPRT